MSFQLLQIQTFECATCHQLYNEQNIRETTEQKIIFGANAYAVCPCCGMDVSKTMMKSKAYQKRADKWIAKLAIRQP